MDIGLRTIREASRRMEILCRQQMGTSSGSRKWSPEPNQVLPGVGSVPEDRCSGQPSLALRCKAKGMSFASSPRWASLHVRNYRIYFLGELFAKAGVWIQITALSWLVLDLTDSGTALGFVFGSRFLPVLLLGPWGGLIADRNDKRKVLRSTQLASFALGLVLAVLIGADAIELWMVYGLSIGLGLVNVVDMPARQSFISELVDESQLPNAVTLNSVMVNASRIVGPALAGLIISVFGIAPAFVVFAVSSLAVIVSLKLIDDEQLRISAPQASGKGQIREGLRYVRNHEQLSATVVMLAFVGAFAWNFQVTVSLMAKETFEGDAGTLGVLMSAMGVGAIIGGLVTASRTTVSIRTSSFAAMRFGIAILGVALSPNVVVAVGAMVVAGFASIMFTSTSKSVLQLRAVPEMRGRVMALWAVCIAGSTPIGAPIVGWVGQTFGPRWAMVVGAVASFGVGAFYYVRSTRTKDASNPAGRVVPVSG